MALRISQRAAVTSLSLTPLIDVVFLLLIFFLVATRFSEDEQELDLELPSASEARPLTARPQDLYININAQGDYYVNGKFLSLPELEAQMASSALNNPLGQSVVIRADGRCAFHRVAAATDACHRAGVHDIRLHSQAE